MSGLSPSGRDAALHRMRVFNRVLAGTAIAFTGVLADVAAQAFPGHSRRISAATRTSKPPARRARAHSSHHSDKLSAPAQAPATSTQSAPATSTQSAPATSTQSAPAPQPAAPAPTPQPAAPVVSGGS
jgi:hypothetical protein